MLLSFASLERPNGLSYVYRISPKTQTFDEIITWLEDIQKKFSNWDDSK